LSGGKARDLYLLGKSMGGGLGPNAKGCEGENGSMVTKFQIKKTSNRNSNRPY